MLKEFILDYWQTDEWYVGRLKEMPSFIYQGKKEKNYLIVCITIY